MNLLFLNAYILERTVTEAYIFLRPFLLRYTWSDW